jgi:predicted phosphoadenosine phosphosulfate sulfurtransferase
MPIDEDSRVQFADSDELCQYVRDNTGPEVFLSFSGGKDACACWLQLRRYFSKVIPVFGYYVPGLEFVERTIRYYEDFFQTKIHRVPASVFLNMLRHETMQTPAVSEATGRTFIYMGLTADNTMQYFRDLHDCPDAMEAIGRRAADSMSRRNAMLKYGTILPASQEFYPVYDWDFDRMEKEFRQAGLKLSADYRLWNRSFDSVRARFLPQIIEHYPRDWERIKKLFPMVACDLWRRHFYEKDPQLFAPDYTYANRGK